MTYRTPENLIRGIMAGVYSLDEGHAPALKIPEPERVQSALNVLASNGIKTATKQDDNTITIGAAEANLATDILDRALVNGVIQAKPLMVSAEAIKVPETHEGPVDFTHEPHPPEGGQKIGEEVAPVKKTNELEINQGSVDADGAVTLQPRSLHNRMENQMKKIDESVTDSDIITLVNTAARAVTSGELAQATGITASEEFNSRVANLAEAGHFQAADGFFGKNTPLVEGVEQVDELSKGTLANYVDKASTDVHNNAFRAGEKWNSQDIKGSTKPLVKSIKRQSGIKKAVTKLTKEETELNELSFGTIKSYTKKGMEQVRAASSSDKLDGRIARRKVQIDKAKAKNNATLTKAAFGESTVTPADTVLRILAEAKGQRLIAVHHSECGKHSAKVYHDREWGEHIVKYHLNGKHHEPADSHHGDAEDAHGTARQEMKRATKLNGALKEAVELGEDLDWLNEEVDQIDEISKSLAGHYIKVAANKTREHEGDNRKAVDNIMRGKGDRAANFAQLDKAQRGNTNRFKGISKAADKLSGKAKVLAKEEVADEGDLPFQPIEEISKGTLARYAIKAVASKNHLNTQGDKHGTELGKIHAHNNRTEYNHETAKKHVTLAKSHEDKMEASYGKARKRGEGIKKAVRKLGEEVEQLDEFTKVGTYTNKSGAVVTMHRHGEDKNHHMLVHSGKVVATHHGPAEDFHKKITKDGFSGALHESLELTEAKKVDPEVEAAKKHLFKHPEADAIGNSIHNAIRHFNYSQDACDHVYSNHMREVSYEDYHKIKPHLEATFKAHGLK